MGTEFLVLFLPVPPIVWAWNLWQCRNRESRAKHLSLLFAGAIFIAIMGHPFRSHQFMMQGLVVGSFFYLPLYLVAVLAVSRVFKFVERRKSVPE